MFEVLSIVIYIYINKYLIVADNSRNRLGDNWERAVVKSLLYYFRFKGVEVPLIRPRVIPGADCAQFDILTDVVDSTHRLAIECKTIRSDFLSYELSRGSDSQVVRQTKYLKKTARRGYLFVLYRGVCCNEGYLVPWSVVLSSLKSGGLHIDSIRNKGIELVKCGSEYLIPGDIDL